MYVTCTQNRASSNASPLVYIYGLPDHATKELVKALFEHEGKILNLYIHRQHNLTGPIGRRACGALLCARG